MISRLSRSVLRTRFTPALRSFRSCQTATRPAPSAGVSIPIIPATRDDAELINLFDNPKLGLRLSLSPTGLFGHDRLRDPASFIQLADATLVRAQLLTNRILRARESRDELLKVIKNLDRLSDMLCGVIDLAELVRNAHPEQAWVDAANHAYESMCEFMNVLNTHVGLYEVRLSLQS
jgi:mitochondrial intermediate peptidase